MRRCLIWRGRVIGGALDVNWLDLCAGIGGFHLGIDVPPVLVCEKNKFSRQTYEANFTPRRWVDDLTTLDPCDVPPHHLLCAGFPCQPFSPAGARRGFEDARGTIFFYLARIIQHHTPDVVILENVKNLRTHDKGRTYNRIATILSLDLGYSINTAVLDSAHFGIPQRRQRVYIVAWRRKLAPYFRFPHLTGKTTQVATILDPVDERCRLTDKQWDTLVQHRKKQQARGNSFGYKLVTPDDVCTPTLVASYYTDYADILIKRDDGNPFRLSPRECARLQGFPDDFIIPVSDTQAYQQFGNAASVPVVRALFGAVKEQLLWRLYA